MTKNFCDLCDKPAASLMPEIKVEFPNMKWSGSRRSKNSVDYTDGTWIPFINARMVFEAHDLPNSMSNFNPDLCKDCIAELLLKMRNKLLHP